MMGREKNERHRRLRYLTLSAMLTALSVVILYMGSLLDILTLTVVGIVSVFMLFAVRELPVIYRLFIYVGTSILAALFMPTPETPLLYATFGGLYPLLKFPMERLHRFFTVMLKLLFFNTVITAFELCSVFVFGLPSSVWYMLLLLYLVANPTFYIYDRLLDRLLIDYEVRLRPRLARYL